MSTVAPGMTAPLASCTVPVTLADVSVCASAAREAGTSQTAMHRPRAPSPDLVMRGSDSIVENMLIATRQRDRGTTQYTSSAKHRDLNRDARLA